MKENNIVSEDLNTPGKIPYIAPDITEIGSLSSLTQHVPGVGPDGDSWPDCTRS